MYFSPFVDSVLNGRTIMQVAMDVYETSTGQKHRSDDEQHRDQMALAACLLSWDRCKQSKSDRFDRAVKELMIACLAEASHEENCDPKYFSGYDAPSEIRREAIVCKYDRRAKCQVIPVGTPQREYSSDRVLLIESGDDLYSISKFIKPFCIIEKQQWMQSPLVDV